MASKAANSATWTDSEHSRTCIARMMICAVENVRDAGEDLATVNMYERAVGYLDDGANCTCPTVAESDEDERGGGDAYDDLTLVNLDVIVEILRDEFDVEAVVAMTGGGVATIYAGPVYLDSDGVERRPAVAGPGTYAYSDDGDSVARLDGLVVGADDDGEGDPIEVALIGCLTERDVARVIGAQASVRPFGDVLDASEIEILGFDSTLRGGHR